MRRAKTKAPDPSKRAFRTLLILVVVIIGITIGLYQLAAFSKNQFNQYSVSDIDGDYSSIQPVPAIIDPAHRVLFGELEANNYYKPYYTDDDGFSSTDAIDAVTDRFPEIKKSLKGKDFFSLYDACAYLNSTGQNEKEFLCIRHYIENRFMRDEDANGFEHFLNYMEKYYLEPTYDLLKSSQLKRAKWFCDQMIRRINLIDTYPLNHMPVHQRMFINKIYLVDLLLSDEEEIFRASGQLSNLIPYCQADSVYTKAEGTAQELDSLFSLNISLNHNVDADSLFLLPYKKYWRAIYSFRRRDYNSTLSIFEAPGLPAKNKQLTNLVTIMKARCYFWNCINNDLKEKDLAIARIDSLANLVDDIQLKSDLDVYVTYLQDGAVETSYASQGSNDEGSTTTNTRRSQRAQPDAQYREFLNRVKKDVIKEIIELLEKNDHEF